MADQDGAPAAVDPLPPPAPVQMDAAQLQQLLAHMGQPAGPRNPVIKLPVLEKTDATEFLTWKHLVRIGIAGLPDDDRVRRQQIALAIQGAAARATQHVNWEAHTVDTLLAAYEAVFVSTAASNLSLITFEQAEQSEHETVIQWHSRLRVLFRQAYPDDPNPEVARALIQRFLRGLADPVVCQQAWRSNPVDYQTALTNAQNEVAALGMIQHKTGSVVAKPLRVKEELQIGAINCWSCGSPNHLQKDCYTNRAGSTRQAKRSKPFGGGKGLSNGNRRSPPGPTGKKGARPRGRNVNVLTEEDSTLDCEGGN